MADTSKKVSELETASQVNNTDLMMLSQGSAGSGFASLKTTILALAQKIVTGINFTSALETENKTIAGAINEVAQGGGGSSTFAGLSDVDIDDTTLANGQVPKWNSTTEKWENGNAGGGSGGHTILDDSGTSLAQEDDLQFKGTYSEDDSTNGKTVVNITREMTQAQYDLLSANEKKGIIRITDDNYVCDLTEVKYSEGVNAKQKIDSILNWTLVGSQTGNTDVSLPSDFNELVIFAHETNDYSISFTWHIINEELATTKRSFRQGYYLNSSNNGSIIASVSKTLATISSYSVGGTSYIERIIFEVYAR